MSEARDVILGRVRAALQDVPADERPEDVPVVRDYRQIDTLRTGEELAATLTERLVDYGAQVVRCGQEELGVQITSACARWRLRRLGVPAGLPEHWRPAGPELVVDDGDSTGDLDRLDAALTGCVAAVAETGTIVLDGGSRCGRRALTLVPDTHICVVEMDQLVSIVPEAISGLASDHVRRVRPITLISGPSATSDIELARVDGVHGPRNLLVFLAC